jgi:hypothetical protein
MHAVSLGGASRKNSVQPGHLQPTAAARSAKPPATSAASRDTTTPTTSPGMTPWGAHPNRSRALH